MPQTYQVTTDQGTYHVTVDDTPPYVPSGEVQAHSGAQPPAYPEGEDPHHSPLGKLNYALEPLAHPQTASDLAGLAIPGGVPGAALDALKPLGQAAVKYGGAAVDAGTALLPMRARAAVKVLGELKPWTWNSPFTAAGREGRAAAASRAFNELPLTKQMDQLPATEAPATTRGSAPPYQSPPPPANSAPATLEELRKAGVGRGTMAEAQGQPWSAPFTPIASHAQAAPLPEPPSNVAAVPVSTPLGNPRVTNVNPKYPWTPEQSSQIRLGLQDWHSGAAPGSKAARGAQNLHIEDANLDQRYRQLLDDPKAAWLLPLLAPQVRNALLAQMKSRPDE